MEARIPENTNDPVIILEKTIIPRKIAKMESK